MYIGLLSKTTQNTFRDNSPSRKTQKDQNNKTRWLTETIFIYQRDSDDSLHNVGQTNLTKNPFYLNQTLRIEEIFKTNEDIKDSHVLLKYNPNSKSWDTV